MRKRALIGALALLATGCTALEEEPIAKQGTDAQSANNGTEPDAALPGDVGGDLLTLWGTSGAADGAGGKSPDGFALCSAADIVTEDLRPDSPIELKTGPWASPERDEVGHCGTGSETAAWRLMNCERISLGLAPFACDLRLVWVGRSHSKDMVDNRFFAHESANGDTSFDRMGAAGITWAEAAENVAQGADYEATHFGWMDSSSHRPRVADTRFEDTGVGLAVDGARILLTAGFIEH